MLTLTYETSSSEDYLETKLQARFDKSGQIFDETEEELMDFISQLHQEFKIEEELVNINPETPCLSESTEVINEIPVKLPSQFLIYKITTSFGENLDPLSMNIKIAVAKY